MCDGAKLATDPGRRWLTCATRSACAAATSRCSPFPPRHSYVKHRPLPTAPAFRKRIEPAKKLNRKSVQCSAYAIKAARFARYPMFRVIWALGWGAGLKSVTGLCCRGARRGTEASADRSLSRHSILSRAVPDTARAHRAPSIHHAIGLKRSPYRFPTECSPAHPQSNAQANRPLAQGS